MLPADERGGSDAVARAARPIGVDEVVLRAITAGDTIEETLTLLRAAKPT